MGEMFPTVMASIADMLQAKTKDGKPDMAIRESGVRIWKDLQSQTFNQDIEAWKREYEVMDRLLRHQEKSSGDDEPEFVRQAK